MMRKTEFLAVLFAVAACAMAQDPDPPSRVARLNYLSGSVSFRPGTVDEWSAATLNYPLTVGDHLWAEPGSRAEMHIGSSAIRMDSQTALSFLNLDDRTVQLSVTQGSVDLRVREMADDDSYEVDTPNVAITILRPGSYRIDADGQSNTTRVTVIAGDVAVTGGGVAFPVHARQSAQISGMDDLQYQVLALPMADEFDEWCDQRDRLEDRVESARYVPTEMTGYEDLDRYGTWRQEPDYGWVWMPGSVDPGWAPYRYGRWCWIDPWGWTWVDDAPWGFAPFHYGRWAYLGGGWVWVPGPRSPGRPVYAPALVVFVGGPRFTSSAVWFPLGPREAYHPMYRASDRYYRNMNGSFNVVVGRYSNQGIASAVTAVRVSDFGSGRHVLRTSLSVDVREVARAPVAGFSAPIQPRRESVLPGPAREGPRFAERPVVVRTAPPVRSGFDGGAPPRAPAVRIAAPARQESPRMDSPRPADQPRIYQSPRQVDQPRVEQPRIVDQPRIYEQPRPVQQPRPADQPRPIDRTRSVDQPRQFDQPRQVEQPRPAEQPRRVEQPRQMEQRRQIEQPRPVEPVRRAEPQRTEQHAPEVRREERQQQREEKRTEQRSERKEDKKQN